MLTNNSASTKLAMRSFHLAIFFAIANLSITACVSNSADSKVDESAREVSTSVPRPVMPNVICLTLQAAQDLIQDQGVFFSRSQDATGQNRSQLVDSNWIVIKQNIRPGQQFSEGDAVLQVLKEDEVENRGLCQ